MHRLFSFKKLLLLTLLTTGIVAYAATPTFINYQGFISNTSGVAQSGSANVTIRIYDAPTGGTLLFEENEGTITIANGYFSVPIGAVGDVNVTTTAASITDLQQKLPQL